MQMQISVVQNTEAVAINSPVILLQSMYTPNAVHSLLHHLLCSHQLSTSKSTKLQAQRLPFPHDATCTQIYRRRRLLLHGVVDSLGQQFPVKVLQQFSNQLGVYTSFVNFNGSIINSILIYSNITRPRLLFLITRYIILLKKTFNRRVVERSSLQAVTSKQATLSHHQQLHSSSSFAVVAASQQQQLHNTWSFTEVAASQVKAHP